MAHKSGLVALVGRPNSGKSTLLNQLIGEKVSIVSNKPQTTRHKILGILSRPDGQILFIDTPGIHKPGHELNKRMMQAVYGSLEDIDLLLLLVDATAPFGAGDQYVIDLVKDQGLKTILLLNKIDLLRKDRLLPLISLYSQKCDFVEIIPVSALKGENLGLLTELILRYLPEGPAYYPEDQFTDRPERFLVGELVREKILRNTLDELPYTTTANVERFQEEATGLVLIYCSIYVERDSHRKIVIGHQGQRLKKIGIEARREIESLLGKHVYLELFVKVKPKWRDDPHFLDSLGMEPN